MKGNGNNRLEDIMLYRPEKCNCMFYNVTLLVEYNMKKAGVNSLN